MNTSPKIGLYINDPQADILPIVRALRAWNLRFEALWRADLRRLKPGDVDVLLLHGGWYGLDREPGMDQHGPQQRGPEHRALAAAVRGFVMTGGGIVGLCCGAYNVIWMDLIEADISRTSGVGPHALETVDGRHPIVKGVVERAVGRRDRAWLPLPVMRIGGPVMFPKHREHMLMSYDWEGRLGAVLAAPCGRGRAVAISPHPERLIGETETGALQTGPLPRCALLLRNALLWSAGADRLPKTSPP